MISAVLIGPLKLTFEIIFSMAFRITQSEGYAIILMSLAINFLVLPLYRCADSMQERARAKEAELSAGIKHIKKTFKGDERMMMLQTYYKQNQYSPLSALSGSVSLLLEIPFFIAAYQFLSSATVLSGASFGIFKDFGAPDAMFQIGSFTVNVLPIIMTIFNIIASVLFLKGAPLQSKIQLYAMAAFFLVFLYESPSGLVFYWTLNNLFSLVKTIFYKLKNPRKVLTILSSVVGLLFYPLTAIFERENVNLQVFALVMLFVLQLPLVISFLKKRITVKQKGEKAALKNDKKVFFLGCLFLSLLLGLFIPSTYIAAEPTEFIHPKFYKNPLWYILGATCLSTGTFMLWFGVFYWLASPKGKAIFDRAIWIACPIMLVNYMFFGRNLGNLSSVLQYEKLYFVFLEHLLNAVVVLALAVAAYFVIVKYKKVTIGVLTLSVAAIAGMSTINVIKSSGEIRTYDVSALTGGEPSFELSKTGQNVVVIMMDRALGAYFPYVMKELEARKADGYDDYSGEFLEGFTYYPNAISFGGSTNFGVPALLGGYEYTPVEMNRRDALRLAEKQNEANLLMPRVFTEPTQSAGAWADKAYVFDPVYVNYNWISDLSVYDDYKDRIKARNVIGYYMDENQARAAVACKDRDFYNFSLTKALPLALQAPFYQGGNYNKVVGTVSSQTILDAARASGVRASFLENYGNLVNLPRATATTEQKVNRFVFISNNMCHEPMMLNEETYDPYVYDEEGNKTSQLVAQVDNTAYNEKYKDRFTLDGEEAKKYGLKGSNHKLRVRSGNQMSHYQTNLCALLKLNRWLENLKEKGVYDNTRIIIASDHGRSLNSVGDLTFVGAPESVERFVPLMLVKDFARDGALKVNGDFMTVADVPTLATQGLFNATNPYTGKAINADEKTAHAQFIITSEHWQTSTNNGYAFEKSKWYSVEKDIWEKNNWKFYDQTTVLKEHAAP